MDGGAWWATVHGVAKSWIGLRDFTFFHFHSGKRVIYFVTPFLETLKLATIAF